MEKFSRIFARGWYSKLCVKTAYVDKTFHCEVWDRDLRILGLAQGFQEYPSRDWCQFQAARMGGEFGEQAIAYLCDRITSSMMIELASATILEAIDKDRHPLGLLALGRVVPTHPRERGYFLKALIRLQELNKIKLVPMKLGTAESLNVRRIDINGVHYGFLKYVKKEEKPLPAKRRLELTK